MKNNIVTSKNKLEETLFQATDVLRNVMDSDKYQNYVLPLMFYFCISDIQDKFIKDNSNITPKAVIKHLGYYIPKQYSVRNLKHDIDNKNFKVSQLQKGFNAVDSHPQFKDIFSSCDLTSDDLGSNPKARTNKIAGLIKVLSQINFANYSGDDLGDAYEYLLSLFASNSGSKGGEFYTPQSVARLLTRITTIAHHGVIKNVDDFCLGSAGLLLNFHRYYKHGKNVNFYGREFNHKTYNLSRMNLAISNVPYKKQHIHWGDTLNKQAINDGITRTGIHKMDVVVTNPPFSHKWGKDGSNDWQDAKQDNDPRFKGYGIAPKTKADYAFLLHGLYQLKDNGVMGIVLPNGPLFRGNQEGKIRKHLLQHHNIDTVIALPSNLFYSTSIPTVMLLVRKHPAHNNVLFIDASKECQKKSKQNIMTKTNLDKIIDTFKNREDVKRFAHVASYKEIKQNDYNLNLPRYVDTFKPEPNISIIGTEEKIINLDKQINKTKTKFNKLASQLIDTKTGKSFKHLNI